MLLIRLIFWLILALIAWGVFWRSYYRVRTQEDEVHFFQTSDGWRLALSRYLPNPENKTSKKSFPVVLCHGLTANRYSFDLPQVSLARFLASRGWDVWSIDLRGSGQSEAPGFFRDKSFGWGFHDYLDQDVPAALETVMKKTQKEKFHWVGHSMGGILGLTSLCRDPELPVASMVSMAAAMDYSSGPSDFNRMKKALPLARTLPVLPWGILSPALAPLAGRVGNWVERFFIDPQNTPPSSLRSLLANGFHHISSPVLRELASSLEKGGLCRKDSKDPYFADLEKIKAPVLNLCGCHDRQCSEGAVRRTYEALGSEDKAMISLGKAQGFSYEYGHYDLLAGQLAEKEVFPKIEEWLQTHSS